MVAILPAVLGLGSILAMGCPCNSGAEPQTPPAPSISGQGAAGYWGPGGYEPRVGSPYYYSTPSHAGQRSQWDSTSYYGGAGYVSATPLQADPYTYHFGPGFYRNSEYGHYRFPYYSYRRPWYFPGPTSYNRDTNLPW